jgi:glycosyltransferase involved in cell wall biosynthesis
MDVVPQTNLTQAEARKRLGMATNEKVALFFGNIAPYKGLKNLILAVSRLAEKNRDVRVIIAGSIKDSKDYWEDVQKTIQAHGLGSNIICRIEHVPDEEVEIYFKAADVLILPYKHIFQSGVIFLSYYFGLPVIATDVGSLREDVIEGVTGFICEPENPDDLADKIEAYFHSDLYGNLEEKRPEIIRMAMEKYSWETIGKKTYSVYSTLA